MVQFSVFSDTNCYCGTCSLPPGISFLSSLKHVACLRMPLDVLGKTKYLSTMADHIPRRFLQPCCNRQKNQISVVEAGTIN